jgi:hypothetical protein
MHENYERHTGKIAIFTSRIEDMQSLPLNESGVLL